MRSLDPQYFLWRLDGSQLPPMTRAIQIGVAARESQMRGHALAGLSALPDAFHHGSGTIEPAYYLPLDDDSDGRIDHVPCHFSSGLPRELLPVLCRAARLLPEGGGSWPLSPVFMGIIGPGGVLGPAQRWTSLTPYITPLDVRRKPGQGARDRAGRSLPEQLLRDINNKARPTPIATDFARGIISGGHFLDSAEFVLDRNRTQAPRGPDGAFVEITFAEPIWGPLALGFGHHCGLGMIGPRGEE